MTPAAPTPSPGDCLVVFYHYVRDPERTAFPRLKALTVADFEAQLDWLGREWNPIDYARLEAAVRGEQSLPDRAALLTFDDGFIDHYETVFPRLRARGWTGVFFVAGSSVDEPPRLLNVHKTQFLLASLGAQAFSDVVQARVEEVLPSNGGGNRLAHRTEVYRYDASPDLAAKHLLNYELPYETTDVVLSTLFHEHIGDAVAFSRSLYASHRMIAEMAAAGMTFGFHSERHPVLSRLDAGVQRGEIVAGAERIRTLTGQRSVPFCYPYGHPHTYNAQTLDALEAGGYSVAFNTTRRLARPGVDPRFEIPRYDARDLQFFVSATSHA